MARAVTVEVELQGQVRRFDTGWSFLIPRPLEPADCTATLEAQQPVLIVADRATPACAAFAFGRAPDRLAAQGAGGVAAWNLTLRAGESAVIQLVMAVGTAVKDSVSAAQRWAGAFDEAFAEARDRWQQRFEAAFTPGNAHFSGHLPTLATDDAHLRRVYYMGVLSMLVLERTNLNPRYRRVFVTGGPRHALTVTYFWDCPSLLWALLDPAEMKEQLKLFLTRDQHGCYAVDFIEEVGVGPWYAANDSSLFGLLAAYLGVTRDLAFLREMVEGKSILQWLEDLALAWQRLAGDDGLLADYGDPSNLLECVPTYTHQVPAFNMANVWMMRIVADIREMLGQLDRARELRALADRVAQAVLDTLYVQGQGYWRCGRPHGSGTEVRHCVDFFSAVRYMGGDLTPSMREEMLRFVEGELIEDGWMRALSLGDDAAPQSDRSDHGPMGAYDRWPAQTITAMCRLGQYGEALDFLHRTEIVTWEGPFGQAHRLRPGGPPQIAPEHEFNVVAGSSFAETAIEALFGYAPDVTGRSALLDSWASRGFAGTLTNLRWGDEQLTVSSGDKGLTVETVASGK
jgi:hypothetical protein